MRAGRGIRGGARSVGAVTACLWLAAAMHAAGGGGPENVALVVNDASWASKAVANEYVHLRGIPPRNVFYLRNVPDIDGATVAELRERILWPVLRAIDGRELSTQIDYLVYSADFPTVIDVSEDIGDSKLPPVVGRQASLTGLTYLHRYVLGTNLNYMSLSPNFYMRRPIFDGLSRPVTVAENKAYAASRQAAMDEATVFDVEPTQGFRALRAWNAEGETVPANEGLHYVLSTMLAVTSGRGTSVAQARRQLQTSVAADGTHPDGTVYLMTNGNIRTSAREWTFASVVAQLRKLGVKAEIHSGSSPRAVNDVVGLCAGTRSAGWRSSLSQFRPGAIADNFTSFGGVMKETGGQTSLAEFLRAGAAAACGAVCEPYAVPEKFPLPFVHVHHARGCSMAEAFYQSVSGPYQLLIVGDPLCAPWARPPEVGLDGVTAGERVSGRLSLTPRLASTNSPAAHHFEIFVDGARAAVCIPGESVDLDLSGVLDGVHELTVVAQGSDAIEAQGRLRVPIVVGSPARAVTLTATAAVQPWNRPATVNVRALGAEAVSVFCNGRQVGALAGAGGLCRIDASVLGPGPVTLRAIGVWAGPDGPRRALSAPCRFEIGPPAVLPGRPLDPERVYTNGLALEAPGGRTIVHVPGDPRNLLANERILPPSAPIKLQTFTAVHADGIYQVQVRTPAKVEITIDGQPLFAGTATDWRFLPVALGAGWHELKLSSAGPKSAGLRLRFGGIGTRSVGMGGGYRCPVAKAD